jgi:uncharacterized protein YciI
MTHTIELSLSPDVEALLLQDAETQGRDLSAVAADRIAERYAELARLAQGRAEGQVLLTGPAHSLDEADERLRAKYNLPDLSHMSRQELAEQADAILTTLPPEKVAEAERLGLI